MTEGNKKRLTAEKRRETQRNAEKRREKKRRTTKKEKNWTEGNEGQEENEEDVLVFVFFILFASTLGMSGVQVVTTIRRGMCLARGDFHG